MERKIGEVFNYNGVKLIVKSGETCIDCYFINLPRCTRDKSITGECARTKRANGDSVLFKEVREENMEERTIKLSFEKAKEFYNKGGEFKNLALSAFTEEELTKIELPKTWREFCEKYSINEEEVFINEISNIEELVDKHEKRDTFVDRNLLPNREAAEAHLALMQLHQLRDCYRQGWKPDGCLRYSIEIQSDNPYVTAYSEINKFLSFQTEELARTFLYNFLDLIKQAGDLI